MSSKAVSYYDWELSFKKKMPISIEKTEVKKEDNNSLGIKENDFRAFLINWKQKNLI